MAKLRAGVIGLGMMGRNHARILANLPEVDFIGVCDSAGDPKNFSQGRSVYRELSQLIAQKLDYAIVSVPTVFHLEIGLELANAGVNALIEKPLSFDYESSKKLAEAFSNLIGAVGHVERYNPALQQARERLDQIGTLIQIATRRQGPFPSRISDVGVVKDLATHDIDLTQWVTGQDYRTISAQTANRSGREDEDLLAVVSSLSGGAIANHLVNWLSPFKERITILTGDKGALVADTLMADLTYYENGDIDSKWDELAKFRGVSEGNVIKYSYEKHEPLKKEHENFRDAILGKPSDIVTMKQALKTASVADAILRSANQKQTVTLENLREK